MEILYLINLVLSIGLCIFIYMIKNKSIMRFLRLVFFSFILFASYNFVVLLNLLGYIDLEIFEPILLFLFIAVFLIAVVNLRKSLMALEHLLKGKGPREAKLEWKR